MSDEAVEIIVRTIDESTAATAKMDAGFAMLAEQLKQLNQSADVTNYQLGAMNETVEESGKKTEETGMSMTELNAGLDVLTKALGYAQQAYSETIAVSMDYAQSVRDLSQITGESAQSTSDLIQVADDFQLSADDLTASMRVLTKNGLVPNKETIISLATQYQAIQDPLAKNEFLIKNLGRASSNYTNMLSENTDKLRANFDSQAQSLQFGEKQIAQAEQLRLAQDQLNDTLEHLKITVGSAVTPAFSAWVSTIQKVIDNTDGVRDKMFSLGAPFHALIDLTQLYGDTANENAAALDENTRAATTNAEAIALTAEQTKAAEAAAQALTATYTSELQMAQSLQSQTDTYSDSMEKLTAKEAELVAARDATPAWDTQKIADYNAKLAEIPGQVADVQAKYSDAMAKMAYDNLVTKLSVDGLTDAEFNQAQQAGVALGVFTQASADRAVAMNNLTTAMANGQITLDQFNKAVQDGSLIVDTTTKNTAQGYDMMTHNIATNSLTATEKITDIATAQDKFAQETTTKTNTAKDAWGNMTSAVSGSIDGLIAKVNEYISTLSKIPPAITTAITVETPAPKSGANEVNQQVGGFVERMNSIRVDIFVDNVFNKSAVI